jgi:hypothetical protein
VTLQTKRIIANSSLLLLLAIAVYWWKFLLTAVGLAIGIGALAAATVYLVDQGVKWRSLQRFRAEWGSRGKDVLLVYSNSPHWQRYIEERWLSKWGSRAVVLNWSERRTWERSRRPEAALFRAFAGQREFNPLVIVVPGSGRRAHMVRFWRAFRDSKHGRDQKLRDAESDLERYLGSA